MSVQFGHLLDKDGTAGPRLEPGPPAVAEHRAGGGGHALIPDDPRCGCGRLREECVRSAARLVWR